MKTEKQEKENVLIGQFFHTLNPQTGDIECQGVVVGTPEPEWYYVQLFSWIDGEPTQRILVPFKDMTDWLFYKNRDCMIFSWEYGMAWQIHKKCEHKEEQKQQKGK